MAQNAKDRLMEKYQDVIFDGMARTLWLSAYADFVEHLDPDDEADEGDSVYDDENVEYERPGPGEDWDDYAPETPLAALKAAHDLGKLIANANDLASGRRNNAYPMAVLFYEAMTIHLGMTFPLYDEPWHDEITKAKGTERKEVIAVYADWLEEQGRVLDAEYIREPSHDVLDFTGHIDEANSFGGYLAWGALGAGVAWSDDHKVARGAHKFEPKSAHFECHYDGVDLTWSGGTMRAQYEEPGQTTTGDVGTGSGLSFEPTIIEVNENDRNWTKHNFVLWFGQGSPTYLRIWANGLEDALDEGIDWLVEHEPDQIVNDQIKETYDELERDYRIDAEMDPAAELGDEVRWRLMDEAEQDTTSGGNAGDHINSDAWGIQFEDPSDLDLLRFTGLTENPPRKPKPPKPPESPYDKLASVMFKDSITARMLRLLAERGQMTQAEFMSTYMTRCNRPTTKYSAARGKPFPSSFQNNFGRFSYSMGRGPNFWSEFYTSAENRNLDDLWNVVRVIGKEPLPRVRGGQTVGESSRNMLRWKGPPIDDLIAKMSPAKKTWAYESLERQMTEDDPLDDHDSYARWIDRLRGVRHNPANWAHYTRSSEYSGDNVLRRERTRAGARRHRDGVYEGREKVVLPKRGR